MRKKGFTLIELLAVIVILAIILLIAVPMIINIIDYVRKAAFRASTHSIIRVAELQHMNNIKDNVNMNVQSSGCSAAGYEVYTYENGIPQGDKILQTKGQKPKEGSVSINSKGEVAVAIHNGKWCARKDYDKSEITLTDDSITTCVIPDDGDGFVDVQLIENNVIALSCSGEVFSGKYTNIKALDKIENLPKIKKIYEDYYFLGENSDLYIIDQVWNDSSETYEERRITVNDVKDVVIGLDRQIAYILLNNGQVMAKGTNEYNVSGTGNSAIIHYEDPAIIPNLTNVRKIAVSQLGPYNSTTMALLEDGTVKIWGFNLGGAEHDGVMNGQKIAYTPKVLPNVTNVVDIVTERYASFAILNDGKVKVWGDNTEFPLGFDTEYITETPIEHPNLSNIKELKLYSVYEGASMLAMKTTGEVLFWGNAFWSNSWENYSTTPTLLSVKNVVSASLTNHKILLIDNDQKLWVLGENNYKSLCIDSDVDVERLNVQECIQNSENFNEEKECLSKVQLVSKHQEYEEILQCYKNANSTEDIFICEDLYGRDLFPSFRNILALYSLEGQYISASNVGQCLQYAMNLEEATECIKNVTLIEKHRQYEGHLECLKPEGWTAECEEFGSDFPDFITVLFEYDMNGKHNPNSENNNYFCPIEFTALQKLPHLSSFKKITFDPYGSNMEDLNVGIRNNQLFSWGSYRIAG